MARILHREILAYIPWKCSQSTEQLTVLGHVERSQGGAHRFHLITSFAQLKPGWGAAWLSQADVGPNACQNHFNQRRGYVILEFGNSRLSGCLTAFTYPPSTLPSLKTYVNCSISFEVILRPSQEHVKDTKKKYMLNQLNIILKCPSTSLWICNYIFYLPFFI